MWLPRLWWCSEDRVTTTASTYATTTDGARTRCGCAINASVATAATSTGTATSIATIGTTVAKRAVAKRSLGGMHKAALPTGAALVRLGSERLVVDRGWIGAGEAEACAVALDEAVEVDALAAARAGG